MRNIAITVGAGSLSTVGQIAYIAATEGEVMSEIAAIQLGAAAATAAAAARLAADIRNANNANKGKK